jgi:hypothetical protein
MCLSHFSFVLCFLSCFKLQWNPYGVMAPLARNITLNWVIGMAMTSNLSREKINLDSSNCKAARILWTCREYVSSSWLHKSHCIWMLQNPSLHQVQSLWYLPTPTILNVLCTSTSWSQLESCRALSDDQWKEFYFWIGRELPKFLLNCLSLFVFGKVYPSLLIWWNEIKKLLCIVIYLS